MSFVLAALVASTLGRWCAERAVLALAIDDPHTWWHGPLPLVLGAVGNLVYGLPLAILAVQLARPFFGRSPGQALWRAGTANRGVVSFVASTLPLWLYSLALLIGQLRATELLLAMTVLWTVARGLHRIRKTAVTAQEVQRV